MNIALIGYGKMGRAIEEIARTKGHTISHIIENSEQLPALQRDKPDVAIEFTQPESVFGNLNFCLTNGVPVISGTTGWQENYGDIVKVCQENQGTFLHSSNFSIGVNLFFELNEWLAERMSKLHFSCELEEIHHTEKKDSPSGTAIKLAEGIQSKRPTIQGWTNEISTDHTKLGIVSKRISNVPGTHTVSYTSKLESINIEHVAHQRSVFAEGAVQVSEWIQNKNGIFTMSDFINQQ
ncbi:MAG: 4-hydroxy-tetrahydrodipicolinate reductase [Cyclobacteriaceae bacterium]